MFEINGKSYSIEQLQDAASRQGIDFGLYLQKMKEQGLVEKQVGFPQDPTASQEDMGSQLDDGSSESVSWFDQTWFGRGFRAASTTGEATDLMAEDFSNIDIKKVREFIAAKEDEARNYVPSERMQKFQKQYIKEGKTWAAFFRGVRKQPGLLPELFVQSLGTQIGTAFDAPESLITAGTGAVTGGAIGSVPGAIAGAMGGLASSMEAALTFGELIEKELKLEGKEFTDENVKELLEGPKGRKIRNRAIGRGLAIGSIEGFTGGLAGKVAATTKQVVKGAKRSTFAAAAAGTTVEAVGGGTGEVAGRLAAAQDMDPAEIGFEAITGTVTAPVNVGYALVTAKTPVYKLNGETVTYDQMKDFVDTADDVDIATADIQMENDFTGIGKKAAAKQEAARTGVLLSGDTETIGLVEEAVAEQNYQANMEFAKKHSKLYGLDFTELTQDEITERFKDTENSDLANSLGGIVDNEIIINKDLAKTKVYGDNVGNHELLHGIIKASGQQGKITQDTINDFLNIIGQENAALIQERIDKNYTKEYMSKNLDEYFTIFSDLIANDEVKFNDSVFTKIQDFIRRFFDKLGFADVDFTSGRGAYNFLKDYNRSIHKGTLSKGVARATKGDITFDETKFSKEASDKVQQIYEDQGVGGAMSIIDEFAPIVNRLVQRRSEAPNFDRQLLTDEINTGQRGIFDLIQEYKPESGVPLAAYINKFLPARAIEASRRVLGEQFTEDVTEARGVAVEEATTDTAETSRRTRGQVVADKLNITDDVTTEVAEANIDATKLTNFKSVPNAVTNTVGKLLGISPAKIKSKANLTAAEVASAQRWFNANRQLVIDSLPDGFDVEGQATGVPRTVLNALYNKRETRAKTKAGLKGQVKRTDIKDSEFLALVDIIDGKPTRNRNTSARIIALADLLGKVITNQEVRKTVPGTDRIRSGMSEALFSKSVDDVINIKSLFELETKGIDKLLDVYNVESTFNLRKEEGREAFIKAIENDLLPLMPREFWFGADSTVFTASNKSYGLSMSKPDEAKIYNDFRDRLKALSKLPDSKFGKPIKGIDNYSISSYSTIFKDNGTIKRNISNGKIKAWNKKVSTIHQAMWQRFNDAIKNDPQKARTIGSYLKLVGNDTNHWHKLGAQFVGYSRNITGKRFEYEHAMPATAAYLYLIDAALGDFNFKASYDLVIENYKLIALDQAMDKKLTSVGLQRRMPKGWDLIENNWWNRYFNSDVAKVKGGINPNSLITIDGKTFGQEFQVNAEGKSIALKDNASRTVKFSKAIENARSTNSKTKSRGMSTFDFDDTLAFTKSGIRYEIPNPSGKPQPGRKAILLVGAAGAGKTTIINELGLRKQGFKYVNQDIALDWLSKNNGLPQNMNDFTREQSDKWRNLQYEAASKAKDKAAKLRGKGDGVVIDSTGVNIREISRDFKDAGYDVQVIYVNSSLENAIARNRTRTERRLTDTTVRNSYEKVQQNLKGIKELVNFFPYSVKEFVEVNVDNIEQGQALPADFVKKVNNFTTGYIKARINAEEFAARGTELLDQGAKFDFSEFNKVVDGTPGPLLQKMKNQVEKYGAKNVYVLTARPAASAGPIQQFLKNQGVNIPLENITGLGRSEGDAKAQWFIEKYAEGYNDMYFVDDALANVEAVKHVFDQLDIKGKSVQAKMQFSKSMNDRFNSILEEVKNIDANKRFSESKARKRGKGKGRFRYFIPPSHEDFVGLLYNFMGKGRKGDQHRAFFEESLIKPLNRAYRELNSAKQAISNDYKALLKQYPDMRKRLTTKTPDGDYLVSDAVRVYLWNKFGFDVPGMTKTDKAELSKIVSSDKDLLTFAESLATISRIKEGYVKPGENWEVGDITTDLVDATGRVGRGKFFQEFIDNSEIIFSKENLNKIEAAYGTNFREALEDVLYRTKNGTNRPTGNNRLVNRFLDYINGSVGATMFFNTRSAVLQQLSLVNFVNFGDNNIFKAAAAFGNQKQFWADYVTLFNSDMLKQRRAGRSFDLNANEIATQVSKSKQPVRAVIKYLLNIGFTPTQLADSNAIALGGASFYRNRIKTYLSQGFSEQEAQAKAFDDFQEVAEATQQSARPDMLSQQQASPLGRIILAFQNTPSQYARLIKKAGLDLINRRKAPGYTTQWQSDMSNISRIIYYTAVQNAIFYGLQTALFAMMFSDDPQDEEFFTKKRDRILNGTIDSILRGSGVGGSVISTIKNAAIKMHEQSQKKSFLKEDNALMMELLQLSPPIGIKARKLQQAEKVLKYNAKEIENTSLLDIENPVYEATALAVEATTNLPAARLHRKAENLNDAMSNEFAWWQRLAMGLGWSKWNLGVTEKELEIEKERSRRSTRTRTRSRSRRQ